MSEHIANILCVVGLGKWRPVGGGGERALALRGLEVKERTKLLLWSEIHIVATEFGVRDPLNFLHRTGF